MASGGTFGGAGGAGSVTKATTRLKTLDPHVLIMMRDVMHTSETAPRLKLGNRAGGGGGGGGGTSTQQIGVNGGSGGTSSSSAVTNAILNSS